MKGTKINFLFNGFNEALEYEKENNMNEIFIKYAEKIQRDIKELFFLHNGDLINPEKTLRQLNEKGNEVKILVFEFDEEETNQEVIKQSKDIICPICKEICMIVFNDYKISFNNCKNGHTFSNVLFNEFDNFQEINESTILCNKCNNNKSETTDNKFYKCCDCKINLCPLCQLMHDKKHIVIDYDIKNYYCDDHGERYIFNCH